MEWLVIQIGMEPLLNTFFQLHIRETFSWNRLVNLTCESVKLSQNPEVNACEAGYGFGPQQLSCIA